MLKRNIKYLTVLLLLLLVLILPVKTMANIGSYKLEQGIPFISAAKDASGNPILLSYEDFNKLFQKFITTVYIIAAIAAFIKILIAGIRWYTSGGSSKAISQSKEDIKNGIIGLCFLFLAGVLIEFINPNLNQISSVFIGNITVTPTTVVNSGGIGVIKGDPYFTGNDGVLLFKQQDGRWGTKPYPNASHSFAENGCVPTSIAMVITKLTGITVTPANLYQLMENNLKDYVDSDGNSKNYAGMAALYGITGTRAMGGVGISNCLTNQGIPAVVVNGGEGPDDPCKQLLNTDGGGHMIVITGINSTDPSYYNVNDPYYNNNSHHMYTSVSSNLINQKCASSYWCFTKTK